MTHTYNRQSNFSDQSAEFAARLYEFGPFCLDANRRLLMKDGEVVPLRPKAVDALLVLVERRGTLVETNELLGLLWPSEQFVELNNLTFTICKIRQALQEKPREHRYIVNYARRGYRFVADVKVSR